MTARPLPEPSIDSKPYWDGLREGRLPIQRCADCGTLRHYPRPMCAVCHSMAVEWIEACGRGRLHSWTEVHHPFVPGFRDALPYIMATVELEEGVRLQCQLLEAEAGRLALDMPVAIVLREVQDGLTLPFARPA